MNKPSWLEKKTVNENSQMYARKFLGDTEKVAAGVFGIIIGFFGYLAGQSLGEPTGAEKVLQIFDYSVCGSSGLTGSTLVLIYTPKAVYDSCRAGVKKLQYKGVLPIK